MPTPARVIALGENSRTIAEWAEETGLSISTIRSRLDVLGWSAEQALAAPADKRFRKGGRPAYGSVRRAPRLRKDSRGNAFARWRSNKRENHLTFGKWGTPEANAAYQRFAAEWAAGGVLGVSGEVTIQGMIDSWMAYVQAEYRKLGKRTSEFHICNAAARSLVALYGDTPAAEFTPARFKAVRESLVSEGLARKTVNSYAYRITRAFRWAAGESLVGPTIHAALEAVDKLKPGRTKARELPRVEAVTPEHVEAVIAALPHNHCGRVVADMIRLQHVTGLRSQHLTAMRPIDLNTNGETWAYLPPPEGTKTLHLHKRPVFYFGPKAQEILRPRLDKPTVFGYEFAGRWRRMTPTNYRKAIARACRLAGIPRWHPHQLRHAAATDIARATESADDAAAMIGDNPETARAVYIHVDPHERQKRELAKRLG